MRHRLSPLFALALLGSHCQSELDRAAPVVVVIDREQVASRDFRFAPDSALASISSTPNRLIAEVHVAQLEEALSVHIPGACPIVVDLDAARPGATVRVAARPYLELGGDRPELGFDRSFQVEAQPGCPQAQRGEITWKQLEGPRLADVRTSNRGFSFSARTPRYDQLLPRAEPGRIVPVSPRTSGRALLEATLHLPDGSEARQRIAVAAISRARGLPNVPVNASVLVGGRDWTLVERPEGATAELSSFGDLTSFRPRVAGRWRLRSDGGQELSLHSAAYADLPLDCSRAGCHEDQRFGTAGGMGSVMTRALAGHLGPLYDPRCALPCHATGEPGLDDGGFDHVARQMDFHLRPDTLGSELPPALERLQNVGCLACHGPGTIPEASARWSILSADVCAYCHDSPPRYAHVESWKNNAMSRADRDTTTRTSRKCATCHTTWGFLSEADGSEATRKPPPDVALGIACAACHDVHQNPARPALVRHREPPRVAAHLDLPRLEPSGICLGCHAPEDSLPGALPSASAVAIFSGRGGFDDRGREITAPGAHTNAERGCLACHGQDHSFAARTDSCNHCHPAPPRDDSLQTHARALWARLAERGAVEPLSQSMNHVGLRFSKPTEPEKLAAYNVSLVLMDSAADVHNPSFATLLLEEASGMLNQPTGGGR